MTREQCTCVACGIIFIKPGRQWSGKYHSRACYDAHRPNAGSGVAVAQRKRVGQTGRMIVTEWRCTDCGETKPLTREYWCPTKDLHRHPCGFLNICRPCRNTRKLAWHRQDKLRCLIAYSTDPPSCACCHETTLGFLTIDHANNDGAAHRQEVLAGGSYTSYAWLRKQGYPQDLGLRVLCFNCNAGRQWNGGVCPHLSA